MDLLLNIALFLISMIVLLRASDWFLNSAEAIGLSMGISPFVIGVTFVAFGTSLPELATSVAAVLNGESEMVVGNVVGSNITNIALVMGLTAIVVRTIHLENNIWHINVPYLYASAFLLWFALYDLIFSWFETLVFLLGAVLFLAYSFKDEDPIPVEERTRATRKNYGLLLLGGVLVWLSADYTIESVQAISIYMGVSPEILALSAIAIGTSLPEVIVSLNAARRGKSAIAVGNVLGSNIFNTFAIMGIPSLLGPLTIPPDILDFYLPLMLVMTILFGVMTNNQKVTRWEGAVLVLFYLLFLAEIFKG